MNLRRCKAATVSAGAISAACQCKCQRSAGASQAADGVSCQSGMIPRWPPPPLSPYPPPLPALIVRCCRCRFASFSAVSLLAGFLSSALSPDLCLQIRRRRRHPPDFSFVVLVPWLRLPPLLSHPAARYRCRRQCNCICCRRRCMTAEPKPPPLEPPQRSKPPRPKPA